MNDSNPVSTFFLGFYDTVTVFLPGAAFWILVYITQQQVKMDPSHAVLGLIVIGTITGYLFLALGNFLFGTYIHPKNIKHKFPKIIVNFLHKLIKMIVREDYNYKGLDLRNATINLLKDKYEINETIDDLGLFQMCDILASKERLNNDRDVLLAKEGLYRALSALFITSTAYYFIFLRNNALDLTVLIILVLLLRICLYGNNYFKKIRQYQIYVSSFLGLKEIKNG